MVQMAGGNYKRCIFRTRFRARNGALVWVEVRTCLIAANNHDGRTALCTIAPANFLEEMTAGRPAESLPAVRARSAASDAGGGPSRGGWLTVGGRATGPPCGWRRRCG